MDFFRLGGRVGGILNTDTFELAFEIHFMELTEAELNLKVWDKGELILCDGNDRTKEVRFETVDGGSFTVRDVKDAIGESEKTFRQHFKDPDHVFFEGLVPVRGRENTFYVWWGS